MLSLSRTSVRRSEASRLLPGRRHRAPPWRFGRGPFRAPQAALTLAVARRSCTGSARPTWRCGLPGSPKPLRRQAASRPAAAMSYLRVSRSGPRSSCLPANPPTTRCLSLPRLAFERGTGRNQGSAISRQQSAISNQQVNPQLPASSFQLPAPTPASQAVQHPAAARLDHELVAIATHGFAPLFLIVADTVRFARANGIPVSTRGSVANSLVAYCTGITTVDPIEHGLLFERFLNPARANPPDIDLDFAAAAATRCCTTSATPTGRNMSLSSAR